MLTSEDTSRPDRPSGDEKKQVPEFALAPGMPFPEDPAYWKMVESLLAGATASFGRRWLTLGDRFSRHWLQRSGSTLLRELDALAKKTSWPGVFFLNLSYEWACTTALVDNGKGGVRMCRAFDWGLPGLARTLCVLRRGTVHGPYVSLTWPMFVGEVTVVAPGRFIIALNRAPARIRRPLGVTLPGAMARFVDWGSIFSRTAIPPMHLLRRVAETAADARQAIEMLATEPISRAAIFAVAGRTMEESGIIERLPNRSRFRAAPVIAANHWMEQNWGGKVLYEKDSYERAQRMAVLQEEKEISGWCVPPVLAPATQYAVQADLAEPEFSVIAYENCQPLTEITRIPLSAG